MITTMTSEDTGSYFQKGFSEWLSEESVYILQRIERWATIARGYNRLRPQRLSPKRYSHAEESPDTSLWCLNNLNALKRLHRRSVDETGRINCCGTFNYQSSGNLDSTCLETYRYDHSIYFKTIGDIKRSKEYHKQKNQQLELDVMALSDSCEDNQRVVTLNGDVRWDFLNDTHDPEMENIMRNVWPIVDLSKLVDCSEQSTKKDAKDLTNDSGKDQTLTRSFRKSRRASKSVRQPIVCGDNNVSWPGVLLSFNNMEPALVSSHHRALNVK